MSLAAAMDVPVMEAEAVPSGSSVDVRLRQRMGWVSASVGLRQ